MYNCLSLFKLHTLVTEKNRELLTHIQHLPDKQMPFKELVIKKGTTFTDWLLPNRVYYVKSGYIKHSIINELGEMRSFSIVAADELLGLATFQKELESPWILDALTEVTLYQLPDALLNLVDPTIASTIMTNYSYLLKVHYMRWYFSHLSGYERIIISLAELLRYTGTKPNDAYSIPPFITHTIIAEFASVSRSYVTRTLKQLEDEGILSLQKRAITILDLAELLSYSEIYQHNYGEEMNFFERSCLCRVS